MSLFPSKSLYILERYKIKIAWIPVYLGLKMLATAYPKYRGLICTSFSYEIAYVYHMLKYIYEHK